MAFRKIQASVDGAMAPIQRVAIKVESEVDGYRRQRYIGGEIGIPVPDMLTQLFKKMPEEFVIQWKINLPEKD